MSTGQELARQRDIFELPDEATVTQKMTAIANFQKLVRAQLVNGHDFGVIPGTGDKPTLLKPGAEKIAKLLGLADQYEVMEKVEDWQKGLFSYTVRCILQDMRSQVVVSSGIGNCNSMESKYRWRQGERKCPVCGQATIIKGKEQYGGGWVCFRKKGGCGATFKDKDQAIEGQQVGRVANDDIYSQVNTLLKMAKKRALVDAALSAGRLSELFTQDLEEGAGTGAAAGATVDSETGEIHDPPPARAEAPRPAPRQAPTPPQPKAETPERAMAVRAGELAKTAGLTPQGLMDWCNEHALAVAGKFWASKDRPLPQGKEEAGLADKVKALDSFKLEVVDKLPAEA